MKISTLAVALALALLAAPAALAGGFATVSLGSLPEDGHASGEPWQARLTILQHGVTPVEGITPRVRIRNGEETRTFRARPADEAGVYRAEVVFPSSGRWEYEVIDGFADTVHTYPPVEIGPRQSAAPGAAERPDALWLIPLGLAGIAVALVLSRRRAGPAPA